MTNAWSDLVNTTLDLAAERGALADRLAGVPDVPAGPRCRAVRGGGCDGTSNGPTREEAAMNEVPTYQPPEGVHGPTLGIALPDGCERLRATWDPHTASADRWLASGAAVDEYLYWWRFPPLKVGDTVQLTGTVTKKYGDGWCMVRIDGDERPGWAFDFPTAALTRVVTP